MTPSGLVVFTDLDGTLLDEKTYSYKASQPAIEKLKRLAVPVILCSSKTYAEMLPLWKELALKAPFIVENGGAIYSPVGYFPFALPGFKTRGSFNVLELGVDVRLLRQALAEAAERSHAAVRPFSAMSIEEVSALTDLTKDQARLALKRKYDEPFVLEQGDQEMLFRSLTDQGLTVTQGGRFFHLIGRHEKGKAVKILLDLYRRKDSGVISVGLGDSGNDLPLLLQVDRPVLVKKSNGSYDPQVLRRMPCIEQTSAIGPVGWREAIDEILKATTA
ncbi:MAG: HAD-IIB family hydrolase [Deltaproteobacteria bacterium]|nr:HAD-IIB family hydrolase [Deltaproteobacteria bacterium]